MRRPQTPSSESLRPCEPVKLPTPDCQNLRPDNLRCPFLGLATETLDLKARLPVLRPQPSPVSP